MELVIMAAGLGSRFGGLKQIEPIDKNGNFIIDYSIFDAIKFGFNKVVFVIRQQNYEIFKNTIGKRIEKHIKTEYAFQENDISKYSPIKIPTNRTKPLGTGHAVLSAKDHISSNFAVINADDYYGYDAIKQISDFLKLGNNSNSHSIVCYKLKNTYINTNPIKRGICEIKNNKLKQITESLIEFDNGKIFATDLANKTSSKQVLSGNELTSVNLFGFSYCFLNYLEQKFIRFLNDNKNNLETCEYFLPTVASDMIAEKIATIDILKTTSTWQGMTYKTDKITVENHINKLKNMNIYPENLWN